MSASITYMKALCTVSSIDWRWQCWCNRSGSQPYNARPTTLQATDMQRYPPRRLVAALPASLLLPAPLRRLRRQAPPLLEPQLDARR